MIAMRLRLKTEAFERQRNFPPVFRLLSFFFCSCDSPGSPSSVKCAKLRLKI